MQLKEFNIIVDIKRNKEIDNIEVVQKDYESNIFNITILNDLNPYNLEGLNVEIAFAKPDGTTVLQDEENRVVITNASEGELYCILNTNTIAAAGKVFAEVRILQDLKVLTTASFNFYVRKAIVDDKTIESTNEIPILNSLIGQANDLIDVIGQIEKQVPEQVILDLNEVSNFVDQLITDVQSLNTHPDNINNPHATTKEQVGLSNVSNIKQASKTEFTNLETTVDEHLAESANKHITESGTNENGSYIKFDDGTMVCFLGKSFPSTLIETADVPPVRYVRKVMTFPHAFTTLESVVSSVHIAGYAGYVGQTVADTTKASFMICIPTTTSMTRDIVVYYTAMGRWKE